MEIFEYVLILLAAVLLSNLINRFIPALSAPIIQIVLGVLVAVIPFGAFGFEFELEPELFFVLFIAPLVFVSSMTADKKTLWAMKKPILNMALVLVVVTVLAVGWLVNWFIPAIPLAAAFALVAALGPTDDVAVDAVEKRVAMPAKLMGILTGESIINDASGIVCFQFAVAAVMTGSFSIAQAAGRFAVVGLGGIVAGLVFTWVKYTFVKWIRSLGMENVTLHILINILTPFLVYMAAEALSLSGILAVFASGIAHSFMREKFNPETVKLNIASDSVWSVLSFTFDGLVFVMLGTQLPDILRIAAMGGFPIGRAQIVLTILLITLLFALLRFVWWVLTVRPKTYRDEEHPLGRAKAGLIFSLAGARGTVTLASVMSIPLFLTNGTAFPQRDLIILLSAGVIIVSLLLTNFVLPLFVTKRTSESKSEEESRAYIEILHNVIGHLGSQVTPENRAATEAVTRIYYGRSMVLERQQGTDRQEAGKEQALRLKILGWERENTLEMLADAKIGKDEAEHYIEVLDVRAAQLTSGKRAGPFKMLGWWLGHLLRRGPAVQRRAGTAQNGFDTLAAANDEMALGKLQALEETEPDPVVEKLIGETEMSLSMRKSRGGGLGGAARAGQDEDKVLEVAAQGFQFERDCVQQMFEAGRISWETAKEMRGNIATLEAQLQKGEA